MSNQNRFRPQSSAFGRPEEAKRRQPKEVALPPERPEVEEEEAVTPPAYAETVPKPSIPLKGKYRLHISDDALRRKDRGRKPKMCVFLSVEGDNTEKDYFNRLNQMLDSSIITVEVLSRKKSGDSSPEQVVGLLEEFLSLPDEGVIPPEVRSLLNCSDEELERYLHNPKELPHDIRKNIERQLLGLEINITYRKYLVDVSGTDDTIFGVVLDRDCGNHTQEQLEQCRKLCKEWEKKGKRKIGFYMSNPCFEFWLLLHLCDVKRDYSEETLEGWIRNADGSANEQGSQQVGKEVSGKARHKKNISQGKFNEWYWPNISTAAERAAQFATDFPALMTELGTNIPDLLRNIGLIT